MLIDTHAHLFWKSFQEDYDQVIKRSVDAGIATIINVGVDVELSKVAADLENDQIKFYSSIGIHPHEALRLGYRLAQGKPLDFHTILQQNIQKLEEIYLKNPQKVIAVGECGLDFFFDPEFILNNVTIEQSKQLQIELFQAQINLAKKLNLPLIIHCRDDRSKNPQNTECWDTCLDMIKDHTGILHCYSGLEQTTKRVIEQTNFLISFAATITYPNNQYLRELAKTLPLEKIVLETDCPFLPPQSKRGQRNEPSTIKEIAELIAQIKNLSFEEVAAKTTQNATAIFKLN